MWQIAKLKIKKLFGAIGEDFFPSSLQIPLRGLFLLFYVFFPLNFFFFPREKEGKDEYLGEHLPPTPTPPYSRAFTDTQFSAGLSAPFLTS